MQINQLPLYAFLDDFLMGCLLAHPLKAKQPHLLRDSRKYFRLVFDKDGPNLFEPSFYNSAKRKHRLLPRHSVFSKSLAVWREIYFLNTSAPKWQTAVWNYLLLCGGKQRWTLYPLTGQTAFARVKVDPRTLSWNKGVICVPVNEVLSIINITTYLPSDRGFVGLKFVSGSP